ncbi:unnamed protein product, partial [marine sediment metagenome]
MKLKLSHGLAVILIGGMLMVSCAAPRLVVQRQVTGAETNCYLLYDPVTREAALVDVGG